MSLDPEHQSPLTLLHTKLEIPSLTARVVRRERLTSLFDRPGEKKVTILSAGPGYGKTTLLGEWISRSSSPSFRTAWVTLDLFDNAPFRFWSYLIAAIKRSSPIIKFSEESLLMRGYDPLDFTRLIPLINEIGNLSTYLNLILDDYHVITDEKINNSIAYLIEHQPKNMHLIISSRTRPEIPLARLRTLGRVEEITTKDLSFSFIETRKYLTDMIKIKLSPDEIKEIYKNTEGWIAGLQMTAITRQSRQGFQFERLRGMDDLASFPEYFSEVILENQGLTIQDFLLKTSILDEFSADLCNTLLETENSQTIIDKLISQNLFIKPIDNQHTWFRYHPIFAWSLARQLLKSDPVLISLLHGKALDWFLKNGYPEKAVIHALQSGHEDKAAEIIDNIAMQAIIDFDVIKLTHWINAIPDSFLSVRPRLGVFNAVACFLLGQYDIARINLKKTEDVLENSNLDNNNPEETQIIRWEINAVRAAVEGVAGDHDKGFSDGNRLLLDTKMEKNFVYAMLTHAMAIALEHKGQLSKAIRVYDLGRQYGLTYKYLYGYFHSSVALAHVRLKQGRLLDAKQEFSQALDFAIELNLENAAVSLAQTGLLEIALEQNNIQEADQLITEVLLNFDKTIFSESAWINHIDRCVAISDYFIYKDDLKKAKDYFDRAIRCHHDYFPASSAMPSSILDTFVRLLRAEAKSTGSNNWFMQAAGFLDPLSLSTFAGQLMQARILLNQGNIPAARELLNHLVSLLHQTEFGGLLIQALVLFAISLFESTETEKAFFTIEEALQVGSREGFTRVFLEEREQIKNLLCEYASSKEYSAFEKKNPGYLDKIIDLLDTDCFKKVTQNEQPEPKVTSLHVLQEPLSERETEVLKLLVVGKSTKEIAEILMVSTNTAKTHIKNIFRKFAVHSRSMLIDRASELNLAK